MRYAPILLLLGALGCGSDTATEPANNTAQTELATDAQPAGESKTESKKRTFKPLTLGGSADSAGTNTTAAKSDEQRLNSIMDKLKPLQVLLGAWRGTTRREFEGFKAVDQHEWVWDLQSDPKQPSLVMSSGGKSPYIKNASMTWLADTDQFRLELTSPENAKRTFIGEFTKPIADVAGDNGKLQRTFALTFTQTEPADAKEQFQYTFNQQENNRYLLEIAKKRGKAAFRRYDTISTQRDGTSFAISDSDYGEKTCIISAGLGTTQVSYKGRTFWVCCSGCKAAFEEDPERWIKRAAEEKK